MNDEFTCVRELWYTQTIWILDARKIKLTEESQTDDHLDWGFPLTFGIWSLFLEFRLHGALHVVHFRPSLGPETQKESAKKQGQLRALSGAIRLMMICAWKVLNMNDDNLAQLFASFEYFQTLSHKNIIYLLKAPSSHNLFTTRDDNGPAEKLHDSMTVLIISQIDLKMVSASVFSL